MSSATSCSVSDKIIEERIVKIEKNNETNSKEYDMILESDKRVKQIKDIRLKKCENIKIES